MSKHTPLPWTFEPRSRNAQYWQVGNASEIPIFSVLCNRPEARDNLEFIVRACNSHEELLAAMKAIAGDPETPWRFASIARQAIARAEGGRK